MTLSAIPRIQVISSLAILATALAFSGCRRKNASPPPQAATAAPAAAPAPPKQPEPPALPPSIVIKDVGFATPESVLYDQANDVYLVSNINGSPGDKDDNGFISKVNPDGTVQTLKWIDGKKADIRLNAPKGMAIANGKLYVADIDFVRVFDLKKGKSLVSIGVPTATFLNDVAAGPDGILYITDTGVKAGPEGFTPTSTDAIYSVGKNGQAKALIKDASLKGPNGVFVDDSGVWVNSYGSKELYQIVDKKKANTVELPAGGLDGLVRLPNGTLFVSSWESSSVYQGNDGKFTVFLSNLKAPADMGYDSKRGQLLVPLFIDNAVVIQPLPASLTQAAAAAAAAPAAAAPAPAPATKAAAPVTAPPSIPAQKSAPVH